MSNIQELLSQKAELERKITEQMKAERETAIAKIRTMMIDFSLTPDDVAKAMGKPAKAKPAKGESQRPVAPKYRHPSTGETWSGRGLKPVWLRKELEGGANIDTYLINPVQ